MSRNRLMVAVFSAGLLLFPYIGIGNASTDTGGYYTSDTSASVSKTDTARPPVEQPLVREGDFAVRLLKELKLGKTGNEAEAEHILAKAGIAPKGGWISNFPVTPDVIGEVSASVRAAAADGRIKMSAKEAEERVYALTKEMNLPIVAGAEKGYVTGETYATETPPEQAPPTVINNYYYEQGPPTVTYYPPPEDYMYLYDWYPYSFWWSGAYYPGYYILDDFDRAVVVNNGTGTVVTTSGPVTVTDGTVTTASGATITNATTKTITNHVVNPATNTVQVIDPVSRTPVTNAAAGARQDFLSARHPVPGGQRTVPSTQATTQARTSAERIFKQSALREPSRGAIGENRLLTPHATVAPSTTAPTVRGTTPPTGRGFEHAPSVIGREPGTSGRTAPAPASPSIGGTRLLTPPRPTPSMGARGGRSSLDNFDPAPSLHGRAPDRFAAGPSTGFASGRTAPTAPSSGFSGMPRGGGFQHSPSLMGSAPRMSAPPAAAPSAPAPSVRSSGGLAPSRGAFSGGFSRGPLLRR